MGFVDSRMFYFHFLCVLFCLGSVPVSFPQQLSESPGLSTSPEFSACAAVSARKSVSGYFVNVAWYC